ncbi:hypothetical protein J6590_068876 [Homalodisca vitripennis]|nr:hypothetical protein J6590_068876 [Homalodisca vitripennis]
MVTNVIHVAVAHGSRTDGGADDVWWVGGGAVLYSVLWATLEWSHRLIRPEVLNFLPQIRTDLAPGPRLVSAGRWLLDCGLQQTSILKFLPGWSSGGGAKSIDAARLPPPPPPQITRVHSGVYYPTTVYYYYHPTRTRSLSMLSEDGWLGHAPNDTPAPPRPELPPNLHVPISKLVFQIVSAARPREIPPTG